MAGPHQDQLDQSAKPVPIGEYCTARKYKKDPRRKTDIYALYGENGSFLGSIKWYAPWRKYSLEVSGPLAHIAPVMFEDKCLDAISMFLKMITSQRKMKRRVEKMYEDSEKRQQLRRRDA